MLQLKALVVPMGIVALAGVAHMFGENVVSYIMLGSGLTLACLIVVNNLSDKE